MKISKRMTFAIAIFLAVLLVLGLIVGYLVFTGYYGQSAPSESQEVSLLATGQFWVIGNLSDITLIFPPEAQSPVDTQSIEDILAFQFSIVNITITRGFDGQLRDYFWWINGALTWSWNYLYSFNVTDVTIEDRSGQFEILGLSTKPWLPHFFESSIHQNYLQFLARVMKK